MGRLVGQALAGVSEGGLMVASEGSRMLIGMYDLDERERIELGIISIPIRLSLKF